MEWCILKNTFIHHTLWEEWNWWVVRFVWCQKNHSRQDIWNECDWMEWVVYTRDNHQSCWMKCDDKWKGHNGYELAISSLIHNCVGACDGDHPRSIHHSIHHMCWCCLLQFLLDDSIQHLLMCKQIKLLPVLFMDTPHNHLLDAFVWRIEPFNKQLITKQILIMLFQLSLILKRNLFHKWHEWL